MMPDFLFDSSGEYSTGEQIEILYDSDQPESASVNSFVQRWFFLLALMLAGTTNTGIVVGLAWLKKNSAQREIAM